MYGKTFFNSLVFTNIFITSFSQYTTICFVSFVSYSVFNEHFFFRKLRFLGGDDGIRTHDPLLAGQVLSQLSYTPILNGS